MRISKFHLCILRVLCHLHEQLLYWFNTLFCIALCNWTSLYLLSCVIHNWTTTTFQILMQSRVKKCYNFSILYNNFKFALKNYYCCLFTNFNWIFATSTILTGCTSTCKTKMSLYSFCSDYVPKLHKLS